ELRRIVLGYDTFKPRVARFIALIEAPLPAELPEDVAQQLAPVREPLSLSVDVERLCLRSTRRRPGRSGAAPLKKAAPMRLFVRRMRAEGEGLSEAFLKVLRRGLAHYDEVVGLEHDGNLERAVVRLFASQLESEQRSRLIQALLRHLIALSAAGVNLDG